MNWNTVLAATGIVLPILGLLVWAYIELRMRKLFVTHAESRRSAEEYKKTDRELRDLYNVLLARLGVVDMDASHCRVDREVLAKNTADLQEQVKQLLDYERASAIKRAEDMGAAAAMRAEDMGKINTRFAALESKLDVLIANRREQRRTTDTLTER